MGIRFLCPYPKRGMADCRRFFQTTLQTPSGHRREEKSAVYAVELAKPELPQDVKDAVEGVRAKIASGEIVVKIVDQKLIK